MEFQVPIIVSLCLNVYSHSILIYSCCHLSRSTSLYQLNSMSEQLLALQPGIMPYIVVMHRIPRVCYSFAIPERPNSLKLFDYIFLGFPVKTQNQISNQRNIINAIIDFFFFTFIFWGRGYL